MQTICSYPIMIQEEYELVLVPHIERNFHLTTSIHFTTKSLAAILECSHNSDSVSSFFADYFLFLPPTVMLLL